MAEQSTDRVAIVAPLRSGAESRALELVAEGPPFDPGRIGFRRHAVYVSPHEAVFLFEGDDVAREVAGLVDDMVVSASFSAWGPLLAGTPRLAHEAYFWESGEP